MLFIYIHTHPVKKCLADEPEQVLKMYSQIREGAAKAGVKPVATYVAVHDPKQQHRTHGSY